MRFLVGRRPAKIPFSLRHYLNIHPYQNKPTEVDMHAWGEPFFIGGKYEGKPVISVLGPGTFWAKRSKELRVIGEASNSSDYDEMADVLEARRKGDVFGRWYSEFCVHGEIGYIHFNILEEITQDQFEEERYGFMSKRPSKAQASG